MRQSVVPGDNAPRAMRAREAGEFLATLVGLDNPIPAETMWRYARQGIVKTIRLGRLCYFRTTDLEQFVANGGNYIEVSRGAE